MKKYIFHSFTAVTVVAALLAVPVPAMAEETENPAVETGSAEAGPDNVVDSGADDRKQVSQTKFGRDPKPGIDAFFKRHFKLDFELVNLFQYSNDSDFDRSAPQPDTYGQEVGFLGTFLKPQLTVTVSDFFKFYWELELGLDLWSRNSTDATLGDGGDTAAFGIRQRELYGQIDWKKFSARLGYQRLTDVSGLFINHWIGAASLRYGGERESHIRAFGGQMPDQTYEGWALTENSLKNDVYVAGLDGQWVFKPWVKLVVGAYYLADLSLTDFRRDVGVLSAGVAFEGQGWDARVAGVGQFGKRDRAAGDGGDSNIAAWGVVADGGYSTKHFEFRLSGTVLSADDSSEINDSSAFIWSGKRPGLSILLSENELRDVGTNIDERMSSREGQFSGTTAGLGGVDLALFYKPVDYIRLGIVTAQLFTLNPDNTLGSSFVASENDLVFEADLLHNLLKIRATGGIVFPGDAGAATINRIDAYALNRIYFCQLGVVMNF